MKRTAVLAKIVATLNNLDDVKLTNKMKATVLLAEVEKAGMIPDSWEWFDHKENDLEKYDTVINMLDEGGASEHGVIAWEQE